MVSFHQVSSHDKPSPAVLLGLVSNARLGWSWAEPLAGLVIAAVALREDSRRGPARVTASRP